MRPQAQALPAVQALRAFLQPRSFSITTTSAIGAAASSSSQAASLSTPLCFHEFAQLSRVKHSSRSRPDLCSCRAYATAASVRDVTPNTPLIEDPARPPLRKFVKRWQRLGLNPVLAEQVLRSFPHLHDPTAAQKELLAALYKPADVLMRAHTGTGKSLGLLLGLMAKPRVAFKRPSFSSSSSSAAPGAREEIVKHVSASLLIVPSNDLAQQYMRWARQLFPPDRLASLDPVIQSQVRGRNHEGLSPDEQVERLRKTSPHIIICTPNRLWEMLNEPATAALLRIPSLRTIVLDEADALLDLPISLHRGSKWADSTHPSTCLLCLDWIFQRRGTYSGGELVAAAGLEQGRERMLDERRPPSRERAQVHRNRDKSEKSRSKLMSLSPSSAGRDEGVSLRLKGKEPLQLVCVSATAGSVLRHFMGARTGWIRTGVEHEGRKLAYWVDCTGLSAGAGGATGHLLHTPLEQRIWKDEEAEVRKSVSEVAPSATALPPGLTHHCIVVDPTSAPGDMDQADVSQQKPASDVPLLSIRDMAPLLARTTDVEVREHHRSLVLSSVQLQDHVIDEHLLDAFALLWTSNIGEHQQGMTAQPSTEAPRGQLLPGPDQNLQSLVVIPSQWSLRGVVGKLRELGLPAQALGDATSQHSSESLYVHGSASLRGLDIPNLEHVYIIGAQAVQDSRHYVHIAGRAARLSASAMLEQARHASGSDEARHMTAEAQRSRGRIFTLIRGCEPGKSAAIERALKGKGQGPVRAANRSVIFSSKEMFMARVYRKVGARCTLLRGALPRAALEPASDVVENEEEGYTGEDAFETDVQSAEVENELVLEEDFDSAQQDFETDDATIDISDGAGQSPLVGSLKRPGVVETIHLTDAKGETSGATESSATQAESLNADSEQPTDEPDSKGENWEEQPLRGDQDQLSSDVRDSTFKTGA